MNEQLEEEKPKHVLFVLLGFVAVTLYLHQTQFVGSFNLHEEKTFDTDCV